ncbi:MAG TPA: hypothetical protein PLM91_10750, partial [Bacillota bacterium]|nr:hypothetical protein [Bacillota bacterium]
MASTSISRFYDWFVDTLTDEKLDQVIDEVVGGAKHAGAPRKRPPKGGSLPILPPDWKTRFSSEQKREFVAMMWKRGVREFTEHFHEEYAECKEKTDSYTLDKIEDEKDELISAYGGPAVVLCLVLQPLDYKQELGLRIMDELG